jgi:ketosteroid isomerase-like protein
MNAKPLAYAITVLVLLFAGCAQQQAVVDAPKGPTDAESLAALRVSVMDDYVKAYNAMDAAGLSMTFSTDAVRMNPDKPATVGRDAIAESKAQFEEMQQTYASVSFTEAITDAAVSGDWGYAHGTFQWTAKPKKAGPALDMAGKWLAVAQRQPDGAWKMSRACWNFDAPMPPPAK